MTTPAAVTPKVLTDPGFLLWAPLGTALPTNTVAGSVYTDTWPVAWVNLGATLEGSEFNWATSMEPIKVAEFADPIKQVTTEQEGSIAFSLASFTASNVAKALNGAALTVSGTGATTNTNVEPVDMGSEVRCMIGWESLDKTVRLVLRQTVNAAEVTSAFRRAPDIAVIPCEFRTERPLSAKSFRWSFAGTERG